MTPHRTLGNTPLATPPLVLGGNVFGWTADKAASFRVLDRFVERGGVMIDTADVYSAWVDGHDGGESEAVIGEWFAKSGKRDAVILATKVGMLPGEGGEKLAPARIAAACDASLKRLKTDRIDVYFAHRDDENVAQEDVLEAFGKLIQAGKVRVIGASNFTADRLQSARDIAKHNSGLPSYEVVQPEYNLVARDDFEGALQNYCAAEDLAVTPYFGLASGYLTGKYRTKEDLEGRTRGSRVKQFLEGDGPGVLSAMDRIAADTGATLPQIALAWLASQGGITAPIASARNVEQLDDLMGMLDLELTEDQLGSLTKAGQRQPA